MPEGKPVAVRERNAANVERLDVESIFEVMELEQLCFAYHWTEDQFRLGLERGAFRILGLRLDGVLRGYVAFSVILDEMEILNIAVHPDFRRRRFGAMLLGAAIEHCEQSGVSVGFLDVKESNAPAIDLYRKFGFIQIGTRKRYYPDTGEDALLYRKDFLPAQAPQTREE